MDKTTLLLVEDNTVLRDAMKEILIMNGFHVFTASNGIDALALMDVVLPNLIISDISMPKMGGTEFFKAVQEKPKWETIPFVFLSARENSPEAKISRDLGAEDYLTKPINYVELITTVRARLKRVKQLESARLREAYEVSLTILTDAIESRDNYTPGHVERVQKYAEAMGETLGWDKDQLQCLRFGAILHDVGKIYTEESLLLKETPLTAQDWDIIKAHPNKGEDMLKKIPYLKASAPIIHSHHERWDGSGYPDGLKGEEIPPGARIVAVADVFDAMTHARAYREAYSLEEAYQEILDGAGVLFAPEVVDAFDKLWQDGVIQDIAEVV